MNKELEALEIGIPKLKKLYENSAKKMSSNDILGFDFTFSYLDKALQRLKKIDNANPNEVLKHFNHFEKWYRKICYRVVTSFELDYDLETIKQYILKKQEQEKALNVIFEKGVDVGYLKTCKTLEEYNDNCWDDKEDFNKKLTQEEFNSIKEMT